jgi:hypothetical protein
MKSQNKTVKTAETIAIINPARARPLPLFQFSPFLLNWLSAIGLKIKAIGQIVSERTNPAIANPFHGKTVVVAVVVCMAGFVDVVVVVVVVISFLKLVGVSSLATYSGCVSN